MSIQTYKYLTLLSAIGCLVGSVLASSGVLNSYLNVPTYNFLNRMEWETLSAGLFGLAGIMLVIEQTQNHFQTTNRRISEEAALPIEYVLMEVTKLQEVASQIRLALKMGRDVASADTQMRLRTRHLKNLVDSLGPTVFHYQTLTAISVVVSIWPDGTEVLDSDELFKRSLIDVDRETKVAIEHLTNQLKELGVTPQTGF